jgi:hypothetical protein
MLIGMALLPLAARFLLLFLGARVCAVLGALAGCGARTASGIGGADGCGCGVFWDLRQHFQRQMPIAKIQMAAPIMAAGEVKAQCASGVLSWSSWSRCIVASNSPLYQVRIPCTAWFIVSWFP